MERLLAHATPTTSRCRTHTPLICPHRERCVHHPESGPYCPPPLGKRLPPIEYKHHHRQFPHTPHREILADVAQGKVFASLDMTNSFFQTKMHPDDVSLTAVNTPWGLYKWTVMPMGGHNALVTHQRCMCSALRHLIGDICHIYLDDIII